MRKKDFFTEHTDANVNLTPLIDVVFVILIMFIVVAPLLDLDQIELASHSKVEAKKRFSFQEKSPLRITVFANDSIKINGHLVLEEDLPRYFAYAKKRFPQSHPQLIQDRKACFGTYQLVKNYLEEAGFAELDVILKPG